MHCRRSVLATRAMGIVAILGMGACGGSSPAGPSNNTPGFTLAGATTVSVAPGGSVATFVKATRTGGFAGQLTWTVTGSPAGLTASAMLTPVADSIRINVVAVASLASGTYPVQVNAAATGVTTRHLAIAIVVSPGAAVTFQSIFVGDHHACGLTAAGVAYCWGKNDALQNGTGNTGSGGFDLVPKPVQGGLRFSLLAMPLFGSHMCGLTTAGTSYCWGANDNGEAGDGTTTLHGSPAATSGGRTFRSLAAGSRHTCGVTPTDQVFCWGHNQYGNLGDGSLLDRLTPTAAATGHSWQVIAAGSDHTCALTTAGEPWCWGLGLYGEVGNGTTTTTIPVPTNVFGQHTFTSVVAGFEHSCGLTNAGKAYCWGYNANGEIGDGTTADRLQPVAVSGGLTFQSISAGAFHSCGLTSAGAAYCWGAGASGALGDGTFSNHLVPHLVVGGLTFRWIAAGNNSTCALTTANVAYCWGSNTAGELGIDSFDYKLVPTPVHLP